MKGNHGNGLGESKVFGIIAITLRNGGQKKAKKKGGSKADGKRTRRSSKDPEEGGLDA